MWIDIWSRLKFNDSFCLKPVSSANRTRDRKQKGLPAYLQEPLTKLHFYIVILCEDTLRSPWMVKIEELLKEETTKVWMGQVFCSFDYPCAGPKCSVMQSRILSTRCGIHASFRCRKWYCVCLRRLFFSPEFSDKEVSTGKSHVTHRSKTKLTETTTYTGLCRRYCAQKMLLPDGCLRVKKPFPKLSLVFPINSIRHSSISPRIAKPGNVKKNWRNRILKEIPRCHIFLTPKQEMVYA
jgi:hypothetical protein